MFLLHFLEPKKNFKGVRTLEETFWETLSALIQNAKTDLCIRTLEAFFHVCLL